jgi:hypothetical protein
MESMGIPPPRSDANGRFTISNMPAGKDVVLKLGHPAYAQMSVGARAGDSKLNIELSRGILVRGYVLARGSDSPVANAPVLFLRVVPTPTNFLALSQHDGSYAIRLLPGTYYIKAESANFQTQRPETFVVGDAPATQQHIIHVAGMGKITGKVVDAATEKPIAGALLRREAFGTHIAEATTGPTGEYAFDAAAGENSIRLLGADGYVAPEQGYRVLLEAGETETVPTIWLAPIPKYSLQVFDANEEPVADAYITILKPLQFGWRRTDAEGKVTLDFVHLPDDGQVVGLAEHPNLPRAAAFSIARSQAANAAVTLLPMAEVSGNVKDERGNGLEGVVVEALLLGSANQILTPVWDTLTDKDGSYRWSGTVPYAPQAVVVYGKNKDGESLQGRSEPFILERTAPYVIPTIELSGGRDQPSVLGEKLHWRNFDTLTAHQPGEDDQNTLLFFASASNAEPAIAIAHNASVNLRGRPVRVVLVLDEKIEARDVEVPIRIGNSPSGATTFLLDTEDRVVLETTGLPPLFAINRLTAP